MRLAGKEKIILALGLLGLLFLLAAGGYFLSKRFAPDVVVKPNISESYQQELEAELAQIRQKSAENANDAAVLLEVGILEQKLGRLSDAQRAFKQILKINKQDYLGFMHLGILYDEMGRFDEADKHLRIASELNPRDKRPFQALVKLYKDHYPGKADELDNIFRAGSDYSQSAEIWAEYAQFLEDRRQYRSSWIYWQEVLKAEPENEQAKAAVTRLEKQLGINQ